MKRTTRILGVMITASLLVLSALGTMPVKAMEAAPLTFIVNQLGDTTDGTCDSTNCTLREAITAANTNPDADNINFSVSGTISLTSNLPNINGSLVIDGTNQSIKITGNNTIRVLYILSGTVTLNNLTIQNGYGNPYGGGVFNTGGILTVTNSTFTGNQAGYGGGIANLGTLTIANSTFYGNGATTNGGGVYNEGGSLTILNSTLSANNANSGGGVYNKLAATMNLANSILANSTSGGDCANAGTIGNNTKNLIEDGSCNPVIVGDPILDVLADNGGSTQTMELLIGSPARDAGDNTVCANPPVSNLDQRGVTRPLGPNCDIGAYEAEFISAILITPNPLNFGEQSIGTTSAAKSVLVKNIGTQTIQIQTLSISGEFALVSGSNGCNNKTLAPSGQCSFSVTFSPTTTGPKTGAVLIPSNATSSPDTLVLTGDGTFPVVGLSATSLTFAPQYVDTTSISKIVSITNTGNGTLIIGILYSSGDFILHTNTCNGARLSAGRTCRFRVAFSPLSSGFHSGWIVIPSNASTSPDRVTVTGTTKAGTQLLKMGNFDTVVRPIPWFVSSPQENLVSIRDCYSFRSPFCSAKFIGSSKNYTLAAAQMVFHTGKAGDRYYIGISSRASLVPLGGQYKLIVTFQGTSGVVGSKTLLFINGTHVYQAIGQIYTVPAPYTRIHFNFTYQKTGGTAWFDDALLILLP